MSLGKTLLYVVAGLLGLIVLGVVASIVFAAIAFLWLIARLVVFLLVAGIVGYVGYRIYRWVSGFFATGEELEATSGAPTNTIDEPTDPIEALKEQYANGDLTEAEFERKLERELSAESFDDIDRELQRERL